MGLCFSSEIITKGNNGLHKPSSKVSPATMPESFQTSAEIMHLPNLKRFHFSELKEATNDFGRDNELGPSFCGFKKRLIHGKAVAVKAILPKDRHGEQDGLEKIQCLGQLSHPNFLKLIGFYLEDDHWLLVYEFFSNGSLDNHLRGFGVHHQPLPWNLYMKAALGAAKGLAFVHHEVDMIYEDFKPSYILLDSNCNAKLLDVGLTSSEPIFDKSHFHARFLGTAGYAAPELMSTGTLTAKSNVFSFGMILLEILTGKSAISIYNLSEEPDEWARSLFPIDAHKNSPSPSPRISGQYSTTSARKVAQLAFKCVSKDPSFRPDMNDVVQVLEELQ